MKLFLSEINKREWTTLLKKIGSDRKWFISILNQSKTEYYTINLDASINKKPAIGACTLCQFDEFVDCSIFIYSEFQKKGYGKEIVTQLTSLSPNIKFTVSIYNADSIKFFQSIPFLKRIDSNHVNKTISFKKSNSNVVRST